MKNDDLNNALNYIDDELIEEAKKALLSKSKRLAFSRLTPVVAVFCVVIALTLGIAMTKGSEDPVAVNPELPIITIEADFSGGFGYEGYLVYDISDLVNANPWNDSIAIDSLPVFKNTLKFDFNKRAGNGADPEKMRELLYSMAKKLGLDTEKLEITEDVIPQDQLEQIKKEMEKAGVENIEIYDKPTSIMAKHDGTTIIVRCDETITIWFDEGIALPNEYNFSHNATYDEKLKASEYIKETFSSIIGMKKPKINISGGDYTIHSERLLGVNFFESSENIIEDILGYNFTSVRFGSSEEGRITAIHKNNTDLSKKIGDYPIITTDMAKKTLLEGKYITTVPHEITGTEHIGKVEIIYRTEGTLEYFIPYYKFYIEIEPPQHESLKCYGAYYVPAIEEQYIENMPVWDGSFN